MAMEGKLALKVVKIIIIIIKQNFSHPQKEKGVNSGIDTRFYFPQANEPWNLLGDKRNERQKPRLQLNFKSGEWMYCKRLRRDYNPTLDQKSSVEYRSNCKR